MPGLEGSAASRAPKVVAVEALEAIQLGVAIRPQEVAA